MSPAPPEKESILRRGFAALMPKGGNLMHAVKPDGEPLCGANAGRTDRGGRRRSWHRTYTWISPYHARKSCPDCMELLHDIEEER